MDLLIRLYSCGNVGEGYSELRGLVLVLVACIVVFACLGDGNVSGIDVLMAWRFL